MSESVTERRVRPIEEAATAGNWKQALKECEKWHKKGEKSDKFVALRINVLVHQADQAQRERGEKEAMLLLQRKPALADRDAMDHLASAFNHLNLPERITEMWERAAGAGTNKELTMGWLEDSIANGNWERAQKATTALRKAFPKERQYEFWNILLCYLASTSRNVEESQKQLLGTLAYRMLSNAAKSVPTNTDQLLTPGKFIATPEELYLLVQVYLATGHATEAVDALTSPAFSHTSTIGSQDPQLRHQLLLRALDQSEQWDRAFSICQDVLHIPEYASDDRVWTLLLKASAGAKLDKSPELLRILAEHTDPSRPHNRAAFVASLKHTCSRVQAGHDTTASLLSLCKAYATHHQGAQYFFPDLMPHLRLLSHQEQQSFRAFLEAQESKSQKKALLIFDYAIRPPPDNVAALLRRARAGLELCQSAAETFTGLTDCILIASLDLIRASMLSRNFEYALRALLLLEFCRSGNKDVFPLSVLLIEIYLKLGLVSRAMFLFATLNIKNLQLENAAHILLTRISSTHPHKVVVEKQELDPSQILHAGLDVLARSDKSMTDAIWTGFRHSCYSNIVHSRLTRSHLCFSINGWLYRSELDRIGRFKNDSLGPIHHKPIDTYFDQRDYSFLFRAIKDDRKVHEFLRCGPEQQGTYIGCMQFVQNVTGFLRHDLRGNKHLARRAYETTELDIIDQLCQKGDMKELTVTEGCVWKVAYDVRGLIPSVTGERKIECEYVGRRLSGIQYVLEGCLDRISKEKEKRGQQLAQTEKIRGTQVPVWTFLHEGYCILEICQIVNLFVEWVRKQKKTKSVPAPTSKSEASHNDHNIMDILAKEMGNFWSANGGGGQPVTNGDGTSTETRPTEESDKTDSSDAKRVEKGLGLDTDRLMQWEMRAEELRLEVRELASDVLVDLGKKDVKHRLVDVAFGHDPEEQDQEIKEENEKWEKVMWKLCETKDAREKIMGECERIRDSWDDAAGGLLKVEVKGWK